MFSIGYNFPSILCRHDTGWLSTVDYSQGEVVIKSNNQLKDINTLQHELRTSLTIILGAVNFLNEEPLTPRQREYVAYISSSANALLSVANEML